MDAQLALHGQYGALLLDVLPLDRTSQLALLEECGIRPALLSSQDAFLTIEQSNRLIQKVIEVSGQPWMGLIFGERLNLMTHGALGQAVLSCNTLKQAIELLLKYYRTRLIHARLELLYEDDLAVLIFDFDQEFSPSYRFMIETVFVCLVKTSMFFFGMKLMHQGHVQLSYEEPEYLKHYKNTFFDGVTFNAPRNALCFQRSLLDLPMAMPNPSALKQAEQACNELMARLPQQTSLVEQVKALMFSPTGEQASLEELAQMLYMSSRTLRRKLSGEGYSYRSLAEHAKITEAQRLLCSGEPVESIAEKLNYSDPSNFGRAFKKKTGLSPSAYREAQSGSVT
ncbi:AraC family transcriptional regulator [Litoribrevibacter albus]|uniref:AraC family transcriptional regulator n=1 Tax=Litoribrevibacter albus TaxID=1473156 RepID=A0AA37SFH0_9GAMM|nr:AraC family transcriptional regulator [Litoribrevibacter albus]GLQ33094.1 AraC family transcriptional regulator [Litoribrevibacter albus]